MVSVKLTPLKASHETLAVIFKKMKSMKRILFLTLLLFSVFAFGQNKDISEIEICTKIERYLNASSKKNPFELPSVEEREMIKKSDEITDYAILKAIEYYQLLVSKYPNSEHIIFYLYDIGKLEFDYKKYEDSKVTLNKVIEMINIIIETYPFLKLKLEDSYLILAAIAVEEKENELASQYLKKIRKPEYPICGNEMPSEHYYENLYRSIVKKLEEN